MPTQTPPRRHSASNRGPNADRAARTTHDAWPGDQMRLMEDDLRSWRHDRYRQQPAGGAPVSRPATDDWRWDSGQAD